MKTTQGRQGGRAQPPRAVSRRVGGALLAVLLCIGALWGLCLYEAHHNLSVAEEAEVDGEAERSLEYLRRAVQWHAPLNPWSRAAAERLERRAVGVGDEPANAQSRLEAARLLRFAILTGRSFYTPYSDLLREADSTIAMETEEARGRSPAAIEAALESVADRQPVPYLALTASVALLVFLSTLGAVLAEALERGFGEAVRRGRGRLSIAVLAIVVFALALFAA